MKKFALYSGAALMSAALLFSCSKESEVIDNNEPFESEKTITLTIKASQANTRTHLDGSEVKWDAEGEKLRVFEDAAGTISKFVSSEGTTKDNGQTMTFNVSLTEKEASSFKYYAFYPSGAYQNGDNPTSVGINTKASQTPTATSFDPTADLLIAKSIDNGSTQATSLSMRFARMIAVGKMTIKNLPTNEHIERVTFSAKDGGQDVILAGRTQFNLSTAEPTDGYGKNVAEKSIILDYSALELTADSQTGMTAFFTCYPFELGSDDSFTVEVKTETKTYTRTITLSGSQTLAFIAGEASSFSVNMQNATSSENAVDLCYAYLTADEYHTAGGTGSYSNLTVEKTHGDNWETFAMYNSNSIGIRNSGSNNDSYVKLPEFKDNISSVIVTLGTALAADKKLTLESSATGTTGSIASLTTVANQTTYTFDLSEGSVKTAYLRSSGALAQVSKIEVYAGTDTRGSAQTAPTNVSSEVDSETANAITVSWTAASGATGYKVTLTPSDGDPVTKSVAASATSTSITGLEYSTTYTPSVIALGDLYLVKADSESVSGESVTTGDPSKGQSADDPYTVAEALAVAGELATGGQSEDEVYISGIVSTVSSYNSTYKSITYYISDDGTTTGQFEVFSGKGLDGADFSAITDLAVGDEVTVKGYLKNFSGTLEVYQNSKIVDITYATRYTITVNSATNGTITASAASAGAQGLITLTATPNSGYELDEWTVKDVSDNDVTVTNNQFTMPASDVTVSATFKEKSGYSVTYTQSYSSSGNSVTTSGTAPEGSSCSWTTTYTNSNQLTSGKTMTYTISGFDGKKITGLSLHMKTNASKGEGSVSMKHGDTEFGSYTVPVIGSTYELKEATVTETTIGTGEIVTITISATVNSVYCDYITITYE